MNTSVGFLKRLILQYLFLQTLSRDYDFFYFVQQWPGAYCDTKQSCCYPKSGKPAADFGIHGLWPNYDDGSWPQFCDRRNKFHKSEVSDLIPILEEDWPTLACPSDDGTKFWKHEWEKHGTCSETVLDQHGYFESTLRLKEKFHLLNILKKAGIRPDDEFYNLNGIVEAIREGTGFTPGIKCNKDPWGNSQLHEIFLCVDTSGSDFIECPILPRGRCPSEIQFPKF